MLQMPEVWSSHSQMFGIYKCIDVTTLRGKSDSVIENAVMKITQYMHEYAKYEEKKEIVKKHAISKGIKDGGGPN